MGRVRVAIAVLAVGALLALGSMVAVAAPEAITPSSAERAQYCPPKELQRRVRVLRTYTRKMPAAKRRYFRFVKNRRLRAAFVTKQKAQQTALLRAVFRCV